MAAQQSFDSIYREVRDGTLRPVYYLTGDEDVLKDELTSHITDHALAAHERDFNADIRSAGDVDGERFHALVETPPILAERRVVVVKYLEQWRRNAKVWKVVEQYVENPSPTTVLILHHGGGETSRKSVAGPACHVIVDPLPPNRVTRWLERRAADRGVSLTPEAAQLLQRAVGQDLLGLATEIEKLAAASRGDAITPEAVADLVGMRQGETPEDWVSVVLERDTARAVALLEPVLAGSGVTAVRLVMLLGTELQGVRLASTLSTHAKGRNIQSALFQAIRQARPVGLGDWRATAARWAAVAPRWTALELDRSVRAALAADQALKSTTVTGDRGILTQMLLEMGERQAA